jgi:hypothetical protein
MLAGEEYISQELPDYASERQSFVIKLFLAFIGWTMVFPIMMAKERRVSSTSDRTTLIDTSSIDQNTTSSTKQTLLSHSSKKTQKNKRSADDIKPTKLTPPASAARSTVKVVNRQLNTLCSFCFVVHAIYMLLLTSPDNSFASRTVFETPLFSTQECQYLIQMAERVASKNYEMAQQRMHSMDTTVASGAAGTTNSLTAEQWNATLTDYLQQPYGWQKKRHLSYPTTDLNLVTDPFTREDRAWVQQRLDARLAPILERIFGVPESAIRAKDVSSGVISIPAFSLVFSLSNIQIFLVRYDGDRQAHLPRHYDDGSITFSTLFSDGFEGGGTRYWNRLQGDPATGVEEPFAYVLPKAGTMTTFPALITHEGVQTNKGRRYLLIGFLAVDQIDPWTRRSTGLSWFSSWLSVNWAAVKFREGTKVAWTALEQGRSGDSWVTSNEAGNFFHHAHSALLLLGDILYPHRFSVLVNDTSAEDFLHSLDEEYEKNSPESRKRASWFSGQQIKVGIDGGFVGYWSARELFQDKFLEL